MGIPQNKQELLDAIRATYKTLAGDLARVPPERADEPTLDGHAQGTQISVSNLVAYLIGWNQLVLKWTDGMAKGIAVDFPETGYTWNELGRLAHTFYTDHAGTRYVDLLALFAQVHTRIVTLVEQETDASLYDHPWYRTYTKGRMIQLNTSSPYANARKRLRKWKKVNQIA